MQEILPLGIEPVFSKEQLISELIKITKMGWIKNPRPGNVGGVGNAIEDLLGIKENNLPIPNASEWELKCQRIKSNSLTTLFHMEPSPTALKFVPSILLPYYGWPHQKASSTYHKSEMSFRQTIHGNSRSSRGFKIIINYEETKVEVSFDSDSVTSQNYEWLESVEERIGLSELNPKPYWGFNDLFHKAGTKLRNTFFLLADTKKINGEEFFKYMNVYKLTEFSFGGFLKCLKDGDILVDFDARTGHNHGTKFRLRSNKFATLYEHIEQIV